MYTFSDGRAFRAAHTCEINASVRQCIALKVCRTRNRGVSRPPGLAEQVTELCTGGELFDRIVAKTESTEGHYSEQEAANIVHKILG